jgi:hypothetical protein
MGLGLSVYIGLAVVAFACEPIDSSFYLEPGNRPDHRCCYRATVGICITSRYHTLRMTTAVGILTLVLGIWTLAKVIL